MGEGGEGVWKWRPQDFKPVTQPLLSHSLQRSTRIVQALMDAALAKYLPKIVAPRN
jgi:hypothetical protein